MPVLRFKRGPLPPSPHQGPGGIKPLPLPDPDFVRFRAIHHPELGITVALGEDPIVPTGYSTRDTLARPTISTPAGKTPLTLPIPVILDRFLAGGSVEREWTTLERLMGLGFDDAPLIIVEGASVPHSYSRDRSLVWAFSGDPQNMTSELLPNGDRCRIEALLTVVQVLTIPTVADPTNAKRTFYTITADGPRTLRTIAKAHHTTWRALKVLNPTIHDVDFRMKPGRKIRIA